MSIAIVQSLPATSVNSGSSPQSGAFSSPVTVGNAIFVSVGNFSDTVSSITDTLGNVYSKIQLQTSSPNWGNVEIWGAPVTHGGSGNKITVNLASGSSGTIFAAAEFSGVDASLTLDGSPVVKNVNSNTVSVNTWSTTNANDLLLVTFCAGTGVNTAAYTPPSGFSDIAQETRGATYDNWDFAYQIVSATQSGITPTWNGGGSIGGSGPWASIGVAVKAAVGQTRNSMLMMMGCGS